MWVFLNDAFLSIVQDNNDPSLLLVRSRRKGHIEAVFADAEVVRTPKADYLYRAYVTRATVSLVIAQKLMNIDYSNFKNSIPDDNYHDACANVWGVMHSYQLDQEPKR